MHASTVLFRTRSDDRRSAPNSALRRTRADAGETGRVIGLCCPGSATVVPNSFSTTSPAAAAAASARGLHQSGCPVLPVPFKACPTGQRPHRTGVPVVCSSPDYMVCRSQTSRSTWACVRSDALPVLTRSAPEIRVLRYYFRIIFAFPTMSWIGRSASPPPSEVAGGSFQRSEPTLISRPR
jgi:hypothetical protein